MSSDHRQARLAEVEALSRARRMLDENWRRVLSTAHTEGCSLAEIGKAAGISYQAVAHHVRKRQR